jgi:DNA-binding LacI/PurR family transcriptional regulator
MHSTIKDVAARSGVSIATVSRAINAPELLNARTLAKVRESIEALDFMPSARGRQLRGVRTRLIGVIVPTLANPVFAESLQGIDEAASASDYRLMLMTTDYDSARESRAIETLREQRVDGLIATVADAESNPLLDELDRIGLPYVLAHNDTLCRVAVSVDNRRAARDGVRALLAQGHRRVLMLAGSFTESDRARLRYRGYEDAMLDAGLRPQPPLELDFNAEHLSPAMLAHFNNPATRPSAIFCSNDRLAIMAIRSLVQAGLSVPGDISVLGFDGIPLGEWLSPALASVVTPNREIGRRAWDYLARQLGLTEGATNLATPASPPRLPHSVRIGATIAPFIGSTEFSNESTVSPAPSNKP